MKCPRCGRELVEDSHRTLPLLMCYDCGYIEGRTSGSDLAGKRNFARMQELNLNEMAAFLADGLGVDVHAVAKWLESSTD